MPDVDGTDQHEPRSRISAMGGHQRRRHVRQAHRLRRQAGAAAHGAAARRRTASSRTRPASDDVIKLTDTNGDGVADKREVFYTGVGIGRDGNLEHEQSGFVWGLDNWIYSTYNSFRFRWTPTGILREATGSNGGQWGLTQDDDGKMWFVCAGCERGPLNFQVPIQYGAYRIADEYEPDFDIVWPIAGPRRHAGRHGPRADADRRASITRRRPAVPTSCAATACPTICVGDLLYAEPVGRLIRRAEIVKIEGLTQLRNAYPNSEFILSSDPLFRPVNMKTAPDGTVYIADMYRGIIQEARVGRAGSYLRHKILPVPARQDQSTTAASGACASTARLKFPARRSAPRPASRFRPAGARRPSRSTSRQPRMYDETPAQLVAHLSHANGWWRDTAQRLLVLKQDKSVVPALRDAGARRPDNLARALPRAVDARRARRARPGARARGDEGPNPRMRIQAIRASETLFKAGERVVRRRLSRGDEGRRCRRRAPGDADAERVEGARRGRRDRRPRWTRTTARGIQEIGKLLRVAGRLRGRARRARR